jgi:hypothetical protein
MWPRTLPGGMGMERAWEQLNFSVSREEAQNPLTSIDRGQAEEQLLPLQQTARLPGPASAGPDRRVRQEKLT